MSTFKAAYALTLILISAAGPCSSGIQSWLYPILLLCVRALLSSSEVESSQPWGKGSVFYSYVPDILAAQPKSYITYLSYILKQALYTLMWY